MRKRRAMYPPLSTVFNPDDEIPGLNAPAEDDTVKTPIIQASNTVFKVVDIDLSDETKAKQASPPSKATSTSRPTVSMSDTRASDQNARGSFVASRMARMTRLLSTDTITPVKGSEWREEKEKEKTPIESNKAHESPVSQRRNLPAVPKDVEPFVSTPKSTKITSRKPTKKPKAGVKKSILGFENGEILADKEARKLAEEMDFVVLEVDDVPETKKGKNLVSSVRQTITSIFFEIWKP